MLLAVGIGSANAATPVQVRAIFDEGMYWAGEHGPISEVLERIQVAGFNVYIPCVWHGQTAAWRSRIAPSLQSDAVRNDAFGKFLREAHGRGIQVYPCFTVTLRQGDVRPDLASPSEPEKFFDVHNPNFRSFARDLVAEFVRQYDVDGVNLDYVRAGHVCMAATCNKSYRDQTGRNISLDLAVHQINQNAHEALVSWQRGAVHDLVAGIVSAAREVRPALVVSVAAAPWYEGYEIQGQDSLGWLDAGMVDLVFSMNYQASVDWTTMRRLQKGLSNPAGLAVMVGNYDGEPPAKPVSRSGGALAELVREAESFNASGNYGVYIYSLLTDEQVSALGRRPVPGRNSSQVRPGS